MALTRRGIVWTDANGFTRLTLVNGNATLSTIMSSLKAKSNADVLNWWEGLLTVNGAPAPVAAPFISTQDAAVLTYATTSTSLLKLTLPAPVASIFFADGETVDPAQIAAINAAVIGTAQTPQGATATAFVAGSRSRNDGD